MHNGGSSVVDSATKGMFFNPWLLLTPFYVCVNYGFLGANVRIKRAPFRVRVRVWVWMAGVCTILVTLHELKVHENRAQPLHYCNGVIKCQWLRLMYVFHIQWVWWGRVRSEIKTGRECVWRGRRWMKQRLNWKWREKRTLHAIEELNGGWNITISHSLWNRHKCEIFFIFFFILYRWNS